MITLPFDTFLDILLRRETVYDSIEPLSTSPGDPRPIMIPYSLGVLIKAKDPNEQFVKVFLYQNSHAEIWEIKDWLESIKHRQDLKDTQERRQRLYFLTDHIYNHLLSVFKWPPCASTRRLAEAFAICEGKGELSEKFGIDKVVQKWKEEHERG